MIRLIPLGGLGEIGMNAFAIEYQDDVIVIDCGIYFTGLDHLGVNFAAPNLHALRDKRIVAFIMTHGHEDHIGAIPFVIKGGYKAPVYASPFTSALLAAKALDQGCEIDLRTFEVGATLDLHPFTIETISVNHSIIDAVALVITTPRGVIIHTGDFRIDEKPFYGQQMTLKSFQKEKNVLALLSDSTNAEKTCANHSESSLIPTFEELIQSAPQLTIVSLFASNIGRLGQLFAVAKKLEKRIFLLGRSMQQNVELAAEKGYIDMSILTQDIGAHPRKKILVLATGSQGEVRSGLSRIASNQHPLLKLEPQDRVILSSKSIPGNERAINTMVNQLFMQQADVFYDGAHHTHVSGHASRPELEALMCAVRPQTLIPIHGEMRHLIQHADLATKNNIPHLIMQSGDIWEYGTSWTKVSSTRDTRVHLSESIAIMEGLIRERRHLAQKGAIFVAAYQDDDSGKILDWSLESIGISVNIRAVADEALHLYAKKGLFGKDLAEKVRLELRRHMQRITGEKPITVVQVMG